MYTIVVVIILVIVIGVILNRNPRQYMAGPFGKYWKTTKEVEQKTK